MEELEESKTMTNLSCIDFPRLVYWQAASVDAAASDITPITEYTAVLRVRSEGSFDHTSDDVRAGCS